MLSNFVQKPIGIVTILGAAVGGPYAAFETDIGTQMRQGLASRMVQSPRSENTVNQSEPSDPYSLVASSTSNRTNSAPGFQSSPWNQNEAYHQPVSNGPSNGYGNGNGAPPASQPNPNYTQNYAPSGQIVSTVYGPATVVPIGPQSPFAANLSAFPPSNSLIETRLGPSTVVPGKTDQLWDYTLGTPTLNQIQQQPNTSLGGGTVSDFREVLRFDIVPDWLPQRFSRVSTVTTNVQMDGLRVPLITGTQPNDIAGTLTYFFDASKTLKRIQLHGLTGDPSKLANLMVQFYQLKPEPSLGGQLFTTRWNNRITSVMQISPAPIIYAGADHSKYILFLELNQPSNQYGLSEEATEVLRTSQATQRW